MPNWCYTVYNCIGNKNDILDLYFLIQSLSKRKPIVKSDFGNLWLGNIIAGMGLNQKEYKCRGEIIDLSLEDCDIIVKGEFSLTISQNTAWCEQKGFREAIEKTYKSIKVYYLDEECGCENYSTNDENGIIFPYNYFFYSTGSSNFYETLDEIYQEILSCEKENKDITIKLKKLSYESISELIDKLNKSRGDTSYRLYEVEKTD